MSGLTEKLHAKIDAHAAYAKTEISEHVRRVTETMNRSMGQRVRHTMARIELAKKGMK